METDSGSRRFLPILTVVMLVITAGWVTAEGSLSLANNGDAGVDASVGDTGTSGLGADASSQVDDETTEMEADASTPNADVDPTVEPVDAPHVDAPDTGSTSVSMPTTDGTTEALLEGTEATDNAARSVTDRAYQALPRDVIDLDLALDEGIILDPDVIPLLDLDSIPTASLQAEAHIATTVSFVRTTQEELGAAALGTSTPIPSSSPGDLATFTSPMDPTVGDVHTDANGPTSANHAKANGGTAPNDVAGPTSSGTSDATVQTRTAALPEILLNQGTTAAIAAAAAGLLPYLAWVLYHRIRGHAVLNNPTRKTIYDRVCEEPGLGVKELAAAADVSYSTASYHLDRLRDADMVVVNRDGNRLSFYQNGGEFTEEERELLPLLQNCEAMRVLEDILEHPGTYRARIAERLGVTATTINWHLKALLEAGLVEENREGRTAHLFVPRARLEETVVPLVEKAPSEKMEWANPVMKIQADLGSAAPA